MTTEEYLDVYSPSGEPLNIVRTKKEVHARGDWHHTFHCWLVYRDDQGQDHILVQRRAATKQVYPDKLDVTAAGHIQSGEGLEGGLRELEEELGVHATSADLHAVGQRIWSDETIPGIINREFQNVYLLHDQRPLTTYRLQQSEVAALVDLTILAALDLFLGERTHISGLALVIDASGTQSLVADYPVSVADFILAPDAYQVRVLRAAQRLLAGEANVQF